VADPGFVEGGFRYTLAREKIKAMPSFGAKSRPFLIVFETNYQPYQYCNNRSVFEPIFF
jgi:hypothetical protein